jgi:hypothetical protein
MEMAMMPVLRLSDPTFLNLKDISAWYGTKTPVETIDRLVKEAMEQLGLQNEDEDEAVVSSGAPMTFTATPGLSFTKPLKATIGGKNVQSPRWASILLTMIAQVKSKTGLSGEKLARELNVPARHDKFEDEGFKWHPDLGISVQGQSAADCWKEVDRLARKHGIPAEVEFWWRQNPKALHPGKTGTLKAGA